MADDDLASSLGGYGGQGGLLLPPFAQAAALDPRQLLVKSMLQIGQGQLNQPTYSGASALAKALTIGLGGITGNALSDEYRQASGNTGDMADQAATVLGADHPVTKALRSSSPLVKMMAVQQFGPALGALSKPINVRGNEQTQIAGTPIGTNVQPQSDVGKILTDINNTPPAQRTPLQAALWKQAQDNGVTFGPDGAAVVPGAPGAKGAVAGAVEGAGANARAPAAIAVANDSPQKLSPGETVDINPNRVPVPGQKPPAPALGTQPPLPAFDPNRPPEGKIQPGTEPGASTGTGISSVFPPAAIMDQRIKTIGDVQTEAEAGRKDLQTAALLKQKLHELGTGGPATETLAGISRIAQQFGISPETLSKFGLPNGATEEQAAAVARQLLNEVLKQTFPQRITNADITLEKPTAAGPHLLSESADYLLDNIVTPRAQRAIDRYGHVANLEAADPALHTLRGKLYEFDQNNPLSKYTPDLSRPGVAGKTDQEVATEAARPKPDSPKMVPLDTATKQSAMDAIRKGAPRADVIKRLQDSGFDTSGF